MPDKQIFYENFKIPEAARPYMDIFFTPEEISILGKYGDGIFKAEDIAEYDKEKAGELLQDYYSRGLVSYENMEKGEYRTSDFYSYLDSFVVARTPEYRSIPAEGRKAIDGWYFAAYYDGLDKNPEKVPTGDIILPLDETLQYIDKQEGQAYLSLCDCRALSGDCGLPLNTCVSWKNGINSRAHRGISKEITREEAKQIVLAADKQGLVHTVNKTGVCNCCGDCCYLFRSREKMKSHQFWPKSFYKVELEHENCIGCGLCVKRCQFGVFSYGKPVQADTGSCIGCGVCVTGCPKDALKLIISGL